MHISIQLELFKDRNEVELLREEIREVKRVSDNVRRGLFARHTAMQRMMIAMQEEIDKLKWATKGKVREEDFKLKVV